ncbi:MAG TPA: hypothetical protein VLF89_02840 [Candidatus Saccharimonadales bacterium]|nr:hypothetical protein [Candidatus Saccharimonadales bacterium]
MGKKKIIIAGPCALESREHMLETVIQAKALSVDYVRLSLWKPRTKPGYEGLGEEGIPLLVEAAKMGVNPGVEPIMPDHAQKVAEAVLNATPDGKLLMWVGARNQNHFLQREMSRIAAQSDRIILMVKNQIWHNEKHWEGIIDHILEGGIKKENLWLCHRGFAPHGDNPQGYRNVPDYDMTMRMRDKTGLPMIFDPSHTGGSVKNVFRITKEANQYAFDGYIVEVHPDPKNAITDADQQLTWLEFRQLLEEIGER